MQKNTQQVHEGKIENMQKIAHKPYAKHTQIRKTTAETHAASS